MILISRNRNLMIYSSNIVIICYEECLENTRAKNFDLDDFKQEFYDQIEEMIDGIKSAEGY